MNRILFVVAGLCALMPFLANGQRISYSGQVINARTKAPLSYVNVVVKGKANGTFSDDEGRFKGECSASDTLVFTHIGFVPMVLVARELKERLELVEQQSLIDEVVVEASRKVVKQTLGTGHQRGEIYMGGVFQYALFIENENGRMGTLTALYLRVGHAVDRKRNDRRTAKIRVRIYERDAATGKPGRDILRENVIVTVGPAQRDVKVDLAKYATPFYPQGVFVGLDVLGYVDESGALVSYHYNDAKKHLHIPMTAQAPSAVSYISSHGLGWEKHERPNRQTGEWERLNVCFSADVEF